MLFENAAPTRWLRALRPSANAWMAATLALAVGVSGVAIGASAKLASAEQVIAADEDSAESSTGQLNSGRIVSTLPNVNLVSDREAVIETGVTLASMQLGLSSLSGTAYRDNTLRAAGLELASDREVGGKKALPGGILLSHPVSSTRISSPFGMRKNPTGVGYQFHIGQDYPVPLGTPVRAAADGVVRFAGWHSTGGMRVEIDHGHGVVTGYSHNSRLAVRVGDTVSAGDLIAAAGSTGNSTGSHVHFEVIINGRWVNPADYLPTLPNQPKALTEEELGSLYEVEGATDSASASASAEPTRSSAAPSTDSSNSGSTSSNSGASNSTQSSTPSSSGGATPAAPSSSGATADTTPNTPAEPQVTTSQPAAPASETSAAEGAGTAETAAGE